ncbi:MAG: hypothetical protein OXQ31_15190 [Spirochaetaceae bacterium]|nr:hypothetical protein [Spirochaetaceae bacterium]
MTQLRLPRFRVQLFPLNDGLPQSWRPMEAVPPFTAPFVLRWRAETADWGPDPAPVPQRYEVRLAGPGCDQPVVVPGAGAQAAQAQADLAPVWDRLASGIIRYDIVAFDADGREIGCSLLHNFVKNAHPISLLRFPELSLAEGARVGTVEWDTVTGAMMRHLDPFVVTPTIADAAQARSVAGWRLQIVHGNGCETVDGPGPALDVAPVWDRVAVGPCALRIQALDAAGRCIGVSREIVFKRGCEFVADDGSDRDGAAEPDAAAEREAIRARVDRIAGYLVSVRSPNAHRPALPVHLWHSSMNDFGAVSGSSYPSQFEVGVEGWLLYHDWDRAGGLTVGPDRALREALRMIDWTLEQRTPDAWAYGRLPATTLTRGAIGGHAEGGAISLPGVATIARTYLWAYERTGDDAYLDAAVVAGAALERSQRSDGSWPWRVQAESGEPDPGADYTSQTIEMVRLFRMLDAVYPRAAWRDAARRGLQWLVANPLRTMRWEGYYVDDSGDRPRYTSVSHLDAVWTARFLIAHRDEDPSYERLARDLCRWVENHFVLFGRELHWGNRSVVATEPVTPAVIEKPFYQRTVTGHAANWCGLLLDLHAASGEPEYLAKARAAGRAIRAAVLPDGPVCPESPDRVLRRRPTGESLWFWNAWAVMKGLIELDSRLAEV